MRRPSRTMYIPKEITKLGDLMPNSWLRANPLLLRVHKATPAKRKIMSYKICEIPDVVLPGRRRGAQSGEMKATKIENFRDAIDHFRLSGGFQLFARSQEPDESRRRDVDAGKLTPLASIPLLYESRSE